MKSNSLAPCSLPLSLFWYTVQNRMDEIFDQVDENGDGQLDLHEVVHAARQGHVCGMDEHQVVELFRELNTKNCGTLSRVDISMDTKQLQVRYLLRARPRVCVLLFCFGGVVGG